MYHKILLLCFILIGFTEAAAAQKQQQGLLLKSGSQIRLGSIQVLDKRSLAQTISNTVGVFNILALPGDTLTFSADGYQTADMIVIDLSDKLVYLQPVIQLNEVVIKEFSLKNDIQDAQLGYRRKSVFYTGTPHYYYLVLKPMTFIYENFKSEVIEARRFNRYAKADLEYYKIAERYNDDVIKNAIAIKDSELPDFKRLYRPTLSQLNKWSEYDIIIYIRQCYNSYKNGDPLVY